MHIIESVTQEWSLHKEFLHSANIGSMYKILEACPFYMKWHPNTHTEHDIGYACMNLFYNITALSKSIKLIFRLALKEQQYTQRQVR
jgi:hypothetical protein